MLAFFKFKNLCGMFSIDTVSVVDNNCAVWPVKIVFDKGIFKPSCMVR